MANFLTLNRQALVGFIVASSIILALLSALPANAQQIEEKCTLSREVKIDIQVGASPVPANDIAAIQKDSVVTPSGIITAGGIKTQTGVAVAVGAMSAAQQTAVGKKWGTICLISTINTITDWIFFILLTVAFVFVLLGGFYWISSGSNPENQGKAGKMIFAAVIGIIIAIASRIVPAVVTGILL